MFTPLWRNNVVLLGIGHTNAHVLRMWKMKPPKNANLICVSDFPFVTYSGMLPGVIAGQYPKSAMEIDLIRLAQSAGVRVIIGKVKGIEHSTRSLQFEDRPSLPFDILSIGIGSRPSFTGVNMLDDSRLLAVKPMQTFLDRLAEKLQSASCSANKSRIVIVGGGVGSIEIAFCLHARFFGKPQHVTPELPDRINIEIEIVTGSKSIGTGLASSTVKAVEKEFAARSIRTHCGVRVGSIDGQQLTLANGHTLNADVLIWATSAEGAPLLRNLGLENDDRGFLRTDATLQTIAQRNIFAVGDTGTIDAYGLSKAGVYAVRQGPVLWDNLQQALAHEPLRSYRPQTDFLKLINLGNNVAIAEFKGRAFTSRLAWRLKDRIDQKFLRMYQNYEPMKMLPSADSMPPMRCLGCGGKIGSDVLREVIEDLQIVEQADVRIGLRESDDAAVVATHNNEVTVTTDFFAAPFDDPYLVGRIAALNSASDCFVMGARPTSALAMVQIPLGHPKTQAQIMRELMLGGAHELNAMGAAIVGGHSIEGPRTLIGFTVLGRQLTRPVTKAGLRTGDRLIVSKPVGTGVLLAAWMQSNMPATCYQALIDSMLQSNEIALQLIERFPLSALTDVTGFGLIGHLIEMMKASSVSVTIDKSHVPVLPGCIELIASGIESTLADDNRSLGNRIQTHGLSAESAQDGPLFDPQTGGGLLVGVPAEFADEVVSLLKESGFAFAADIGTVTAESEHPVLTARS